MLFTKRCVRLTSGITLPVVYMWVQAGKPCLRMPVHETILMNNMQTHALKAVGFTNHTSHAPYNLPPCWLIAIRQTYDCVPEFDFDDEYIDP